MPDLIMMRTFSHIISQTYVNQCTYHLECDGLSMDRVGDPLTGIFSIWQMPEFTPVVI